jgi:hypothetical protein
MNIHEIILQMKRLALLDAGICQEWQYRYFSYNARWGPGTQMASLRDGCGSHWYMLLDNKDCAFKVYDKGNKISLDEAIKFIPKGTFFQDFINEPAFLIEEISQIGYFNNGIIKYYGNEVSGPLSVKEVTQWNVDNYANWARPYYEMEVSDIDFINLWNDPSDVDTWSRIISEFDIDGFNNDILEIGWRT